MRDVKKTALSFGFKVLNLKFLSFGKPRSFQRYQLNGASQQKLHQEQMQATKKIYFVTIQLFTSTLNSNPETLNSEKSPTVSGRASTIKVLFTNKNQSGCLLYLQLFSKPGYSGNRPFVFVASRFVYAGLRYPYLC